MNDLELKFTVLKPLWLAYMLEIGEDDSEETLLHDLKQRIIVSEKLPNVSFDLIKSDKKVAGFVFYSIDGGIKNLIPVGYGYIMEIYVLPEFRKQHLAARVCDDLCTYFKNMRCPKVYLTSAKESIEFWMKQGYQDSGLIDPDNHMNIYIKTL